MIALSVIVMLGAHLGTALGHVAVSHALRILQIGEPILGIQRVHFQGGGVHQETRTVEFLMQMMVPKHVADVLAQQTSAGCRLGIGLERVDSPLNLEIPR